MEDLQSALPIIGELVIGSVTPATITAPSFSAQLSPETKLIQVPPPSADHVAPLAEEPPSSQSGDPAQKRVLRILEEGGFTEKMKNSNQAGKRSRQAVELFTPPIDEPKRKSKLKEEPKKKKSKAADPLPEVGFALSVKFEGGFWYPGKVVQTDAEGSRVFIVFDDGQELWEKWPNRGIKPREPTNPAQQTYRELITAALQHHEGKASKDEICAFVAKHRSIEHLSARLSEYTGACWNLLASGKYKLRAKPCGIGADRQAMLLGHDATQTLGNKRQQKLTESPTSKRPKAVSKEGRGSASQAKLKAKAKKPPQPKLTKGEEDRQHIESINVSCLCG
jgi:hypothetical protein